MDRHAQAPQLRAQPVWSPARTRDRLPADRRVPGRGRGRGTVPDDRARGDRNRFAALRQRGRALARPPRRENRGFLPSRSSPRHGSLRPTARCRRRNRRRDRRRRERGRADRRETRRRARSPRSGAPAHLGTGSPVRADGGRDAGRLPGSGGRAGRDLDRLIRGRGAERPRVGRETSRFGRRSRDLSGRREAREFWSRQNSRDLGVSRPVRCPPTVGLERSLHREGFAARPGVSDPGRRPRFLQCGRRRLHRGGGRPPDTLRGGGGRRGRGRVRRPHGDLRAPGLNRPRYLLPPRNALRSRGMAALPRLFTRRRVHRIWWDGSGTLLVGARPV